MSHNRDVFGAAIAHCINMDNAYCQLQNEDNHVVFGFFFLVLEV